MNNLTNINSTIATTEISSSNIILHCEQQIDIILSAKKFSKILESRNIEDDIIKEKNQKTLSEIIKLKNIICNNLMTSIDMIDSKKRDNEKLQETSKQIIESFDNILQMRFNNIELIKLSENKELKLILSLFDRILRIITEHNAFIGVKIMITSEEYSTAYINRKHTNIYFSKYIKKFKKIKDLKKTNLLTLLHSNVTKSKLTIFFQLFIHEKK